MRPSAGADHRIGIGRRHARRVTKELQREDRPDPERNRPAADEPGRNQCGSKRSQQNQPAFAGDEGMCHMFGNT